MEDLRGATRRDRGRGPRSRRPPPAGHRSPPSGEADALRPHLAPRHPGHHPVRTLVDLAACLLRDALEAAVNEADKHDLIDPETLRSALYRYRGQPGVTALREALDRRTFTLTDSELERRFLPVARKASLPRPQTRKYVNGFEVDFYWPDLGLVVETDGLRLPPHTRATGEGPSPRPGAHRRRPHAPPVHTRPGQVRPGSRASDAERGCPPAPSRSRGP